MPRLLPLRPDLQRLISRTFLGAVLVVLIAVAVIHFRVPQTLPPGPGEGEVRIVTYNIRAGLGGLDRVAEDLVKLSADVVALQEVELGVRRSRHIDQARSLGEAVEMEHAFAGSFSVETGEHGIALLSRYPLTDVQVVRLPQSSGRWPRVALTARVEAKSGPFRMVCIHLARPWGWPFSNTGARLAQIEALLEELEKEELPLVVAGDFNCFPISLEGIRVARDLDAAWNPWRDGWATSFSLRAIGWPAGSVKIDHVYHDGGWESRGTWVAPQGASDHRPVISDLRRRPTSS